MKKSTTYNILVIGDLHGSNLWKDILIAYDKFPLHKIVFLGDYTDHWTRKNEVIYNNLVQLIDFKKDNPDVVELLLGNHDIQYWNHINEIYNYRCSGYRAVMHFDLYDLFKENKNLFKIAYQYKNHLFTHAGIHKGWYKFRFMKYVKENETIADSLNLALQYNLKELYDVGWSRGGSQKVGGPLWADKGETFKKPLIGYHQYIGHTSIHEIKTYKISTDTSVTYCDVLEVENIKNIKDYAKLVQIEQTNIKESELWIQEINPEVLYRA